MKSVRTSTSLKKCLSTGSALIHQAYVQRHFSAMTILSFFWGSRITLFNVSFFPLFKVRVWFLKDLLAAYSIEWGKGLVRLLYFSWFIVSFWLIYLFFSFLSENLWNTRHNSSFYQKLELCLLDNTCLRKNFLSY